MTNQEINAVTRRQKALENIRLQGDMTTDTRTKRFSHTQYKNKKQKHITQKPKPHKKRARPRKVPLPNSDNDNNASSLALALALTLAPAIPKLPISKKGVNNTNDNTNLQYNKNLKLPNVIYTKDLLQFRKDNIIYFIDKKGKGIDKGANNLISAGKIKSFSDNNINTLNMQKNKNTKYFGLCINTNESNKLILSNIEKLFTQIINILKDTDKKIISIAESIFIGNQPWTDIINSLHKIIVSNFMKGVNYFGPWLVTYKNAFSYTNDFFICIFKCVYYLSK